MKHVRWVLIAIAAAGMAGCTTLTERNAFLTLAETFGIPTESEEEDDGTGGGGALPDSVFRRTMTLTLANNHPSAELNTSFVAWVNTGSIRSADQQDALLRSGYVLVTREIQLGSVFTIAPGSFIFNGPGVAGATTVVLGPVQSSTRLPTTESFSLVTPDVLLVFSQPPVSCDSVAFYYTSSGDPLNAEPVADPESPFGGATLDGAFKTLAQVDVYQCSPLRPGLFLKLGGGTRQSNEFFEGENVRYDFFEVPNAQGDAAVVAISR